MSNPSGPNAPQSDPEPSAWPLYAPQQPEKKPTGLIILLVVVGLLLLVGSCAAVLASHGESSGPAVQESQPEASASDEPTTDNSTEEPTKQPTKQPTKEPTKEPSPYRQGKLAKAAEQKFIYADGLEIRITNFKRGTVGRNAEGGHPGDPMVLFTVHIKNGTSHKVDADEFVVEVTYGDDDDAEAIHGKGLDDVTGVIAKGRSKTGQYGFAVPIEDMDELYIDVSDDEHDPFFWSVK